MKFPLRTFAALALALLAADVCHGAPTGPVDKKTGTSLIDKKTAAAIGLTRPHKPKGGRHDAARWKNDKADARHGFKAPPDVDSAKHVLGVKSEFFHHTPGLQPDDAKYAPVARAAFVPLQAHSPGPDVKNLTRVPIVKTSLPPAFNVVGGTVMKQHTSTLVAIGGATTGKRTGEINGVSIRAKQQH